MGTQRKQALEKEVAAAKLCVSVLPTITNTRVTLEELHDVICDLHDGISPELKSKPLRLILINKLLEWVALICFEAVQPEDYLEIPYNETTDDLWHTCAVLSWRWSNSKPQVMVAEFSPMKDVQFLRLQVLLHLAKEQGIEYVWIDWCCMPQYSGSPMVEVARSKLYYARARLQLVMPQFKELPEGMVRVLLNRCLRVAKKQHDSADMEDDLGLAITILSRLLERGEIAGREYFGRVWTLAERLARCGRGEKLNQWLPLDSWLGMVVDALLNSDKDHSAADIYWSKLIPAHLRQLLNSVMDKLKVALETCSMQAAKDVELELVRVFEGAVEAWRTSSMAEVPDADWLKQYLTVEAVKVYQAYDFRDLVWAVHSYFVWKDRDMASISMVLEALQDLCKVVQVDIGQTTIQAVLMEAAQKEYTLSHMITWPVEPKVSGPSLLSQMIESKEPKLNCAATWKHHQKIVNCLALSRDGATLVSASDDKTLVVCDAATGRMSCTLPGHTNRVLCVVLTPDGRSAISGSRDETIRVWSLAPSSPSAAAGQGSGGGAAMALLGAPQVTTTEGRVRSMALSGDGRLLATGHYSPHHILLWRVELQHRTSQSDEHAACSGGGGGVVLRRYDVCSPLTGHSGAVRSLVMTRDGKTLVSGSGDHTMRVWSLPCGQCLRTIKGHSDEVTGLALTPDEAILVSASYDSDSTLRLWQLSSGAQLACIKGSYKVAVSADGSTLVSLTENYKQVSVWDLAAIMRDPIACHQPRTTTTECDEIPNAFAIALDGSCFFSGNLGGSVRLWRPALSP